MSAKNFIKLCLSCPLSVLLVVLGVSVFALAGALTGQFLFGLAPCILCLYQRIPFVITSLLSFGTLMFSARLTRHDLMVALCGFCFFINSVLAFYHVGVEEQWWVSAFEACAVPSSFLEAQDTESLLQALWKTPSVPCTQVAWRDPFLGGSMALYNGLLCLGMVVFCALHFAARKRTLK